MTLRTFRTWSSMGYKIKPGARAVAYTFVGDALFSRAQVMDRRNMVRCCQPVRRCGCGRGVYR